jgi:hypothetical protein
MVGVVTEPSSERRDRTGVLIIRVWTEADHDTTLRARITSYLGTAGAEQSQAVAASTAAICAAVERWVEEFAGADR